MGHHRMLKDLSTRSTRVGSTGIAPARVCTMGTARLHRRWRITTGVLGRSTTGCRVRAFRPTIVAHAMWLTIGADTACTSHHVDTTGCAMAVITCWWPLLRV